MAEKPIFTKNLKGMYRRFLRKIRFRWKWVSRGNLACWTRFWWL